MGRKTAVLAKSTRIPPPEPAEASEEPDAIVEDDGADDIEALGPVADGLDGDTVITDNVGEQSVEINVESLIAELEAESGHGSSRDVQCARRKLEDYLERKRIAQELEDFEDFEVED